MKNKKVIKYKGKRVVAQRKEELNSQDRSAFSETFLLGNLADLLYEIKTLAKDARTRNTRIKKNSIAKLRTLLWRYHKLPGANVEEIISLFIYDTFKGLKIPRQNLPKIKSWWLEM